MANDLVAAEAAGFDFSVMSDHYFPWLEEQGHGTPGRRAAAQATGRLPLMTFVTCPAFRYFTRAVVAQKAATMGVLSGGHDGRAVRLRLPGPRRRGKPERHATGGGLAVAAGAASTGWPRRRP